ncbi:enoyl-CoA hydratase/isomerase family protein [Nocardioides sediminis]|uniref:enoyl-CoA hydratase/isomerase family protein n=1 Tax=Nocardioides sediminis TaxID=433648 RepID=UPI000D31D8B4|nr:enoyl-CoA hydratase-related protein [Nocardioides sediminis]
MSDLVRIERRGSMEVLVLNRPGERNPLDRESSSALRAALHAAFEDPAVRSVGITGAGDAFCAGGDLRQMARFREIPVEEAYAWPQAIVDLHKDMLDAPKPVVAAVNGPAFAGGMGLAGMCDIVIASDRASFAMPEAKLGLFPMIIVAHLARSIPRKVLLEMMMTGDAIDAAEAHRIGFANRVVPAAGLDDALAEYAAKLEKVSPVALRLGRKTFTLLADMPASQALDAAQFLNLPFFLGTDLAEGVDAFFGKRRPSWIPTDPSTEQ